jgi:hypothetical protein
MSSSEKVAQLTAARAELLRGMRPLEAKEWNVSRPMSAADKAALAKIRQEVRALETQLKALG